MREKDPENTLLYLQMASSNSVTFKTVKGEWALWKPADLAATNVPVHVVVGENDTNFTPRLMHALHEMIPGSQYCLIQAAGHYAYFENAPEFNRCVLDDLSRITTRSARS